MRNAPKMVRATRQKPVQPVSSQRRTQREQVPPVYILVLFLISECFHRHDRSKKTHTYTYIPAKGQNICPTSRRTASRQRHALRSPSFVQQAKRFCRKDKRTHPLWAARNPPKGIYFKELAHSELQETPLTGICFKELTRRLQETSRRFTLRSTARVEPGTLRLVLVTGAPLTAFAFTFTTYPFCLRDRCFGLIIYAGIVGYVR